MGKSLLIALVALFSVTACTNSNKEETKNEEFTAEANNDSLVSKTYDSLLSAQLGADDYGMRKYVMAFLKKGPNRDQDDSTRQKLQRAHLDNISRLAEEGTLVLAGPFFDDGDIRGIYLFAVDSISQAEQLTNTDPAVRAGSLIMELHEWYGSAAIMKLNEIHKQIAKIEI